MNILRGQKIKSIIGDIAINMVATILPVLMMQFIFLPIVAQKYDDSNYGLALTLISLITLSAQSFSVSLSNTRLLMNTKYIESKTVGDFNVLLIVSCIINVVFLSVGTYLYEGYLNLFNISLIVMISVIQLVRRYLLVAFRLDIYYKGILFSNLMLIAGNLIGLVLFLVTGLWQLIFLCGEAISLIYVIYKTNLLKEPIKITGLFKRTTKHGIVLLLAAFLGAVNTQIDRLFLYPILGPKMVAVYYVSTLFGKTLSMAAAPINNVILTYLSKMKKLKLSYFKLMIITASALGVLSYAFIIIISEPILKVLYPTYAEEALKLIYITTLTAMITMLSTVINPVIMKFCNILWQIWLNVVNIVIFLLLAFYLISLYEIWGFVYAALIAAITKLILMICVYFKKSKEVTDGVM
ncbi:lipopolysaccharide biosynthesis protein [Sutcliffiella horikoshii]|uniref:lipopolysaccharide biosynthesis protein n=1 Tax=Sutcliffiella horikoshii TaxID=79883 RepID=UPI00384FAF45